MIVDSSALIAILRGEPEAARFAALLVDAHQAGHAPRMSAANWLEAAMVADGGAGRTASADFDQIVRESGIDVIAVTNEHARAARAAFRRYGRGSGSPAWLNFGDCIAYATAITEGEPLLYKGDDFPHTDVPGADEEG